MPKKKLSEKQYNKLCSQLSDGDYYYKICRACPIEIEGVKWIIKITGIFNKKGELRCTIKFDCEDGRRRGTLIPKISKEDFDKDIIGDWLYNVLRNHFDNPYDHYKIADVSNLTDLDKQIERLKEMGAVTIYDPEDFKKRYAEINRKQFYGDELN